MNCIIEKSSPADLMQQPIIITAEDVLRVAPSRIKNTGDGVFATADIAAGSVVCEYTGVFRDTTALTDAQSDVAVAVGHGLSVCGEGIAAKINDNIVMRAYTDDEICEIMERGQFPIHPDTAINCVFDVDNAGEFARVYVKAIANIPAGDELYLDYGIDYWMNRLARYSLGNADLISRLTRERLQRRFLGTA